MMAMQGSRKPKMKKNFLGDLPSFLRIVQEKVASSRPRVPQSSNRGGRIIPKENIQTPNIMSMILVLL